SQYNQERIKNLRKKRKIEIEEINQKYNDTLPTYEEVTNKDR
ncbi:19215_t:CDS:2, partial [Funneliformis geosporum]